MASAATIFNDSVSKDRWSFWDGYYLSQNILDLFASILIQIKATAAALKGVSLSSYAKLTHIANDLAELNYILYCFNFLHSIKLIIDRKFIDKKNFLTTASNVSYFASQLLTPIHWLHEQKFISLGRSAAYIGHGIELFEGVSYSFSAISDMITLFKEEWNEERVRAILNLIWFFLWIIGKVLYYTLQPSATSEAIITSLYIVRLSITLYDSLNPLESAGSEFN